MTVSSERVYVVNSTFGGADGFGNTCSNGGGISSIGVSWTLLNSLLSHNRAVGRGGNPATAAKSSPTFEPKGSSAGKSILARVDAQLAGPNKDAFLAEPALGLFAVADAMGARVSGRHAADLIEGTHHAARAGRPREHPALKPDRFRPTLPSPAALLGLLAGALLWALHSAWTVLPVPLLGGVHLPVWWTSLYAAFVVFLVVFCVRLAGWRWPWFERALWLLVLAAPAALYAGAAVERLPEVAEAWRLACIAAVGVGVVAVSVYAWRRRDTASVLLVASGAVSLAFGLRDWEVAHRGVDNNPVFLTPYAALSFIALVAWMLIDGFVHAADALERANAALEERVARKSEAAAA